MQVLQGWRPAERAFSRESKRLRLAGDIRLAWGQWGKWKVLEFLEPTKPAAASADDVVFLSSSDEATKVSGVGLPASHQADATRRAPSKAPSLRRDWIIHPARCSSPV